MITRYINQSRQVLKERQLLLAVILVAVAWAATSLEWQRRAWAASSNANPHRQGFGWDSRHVPERDVKDLFNWRLPVASAWFSPLTAMQGGCVSLTTASSAYTQNFNTLSSTAGSTTNNLTIPGWFMTESGGGARDNEQYAVDTGSSNTGDTYSYGAAGNTERALGGLQSGTLIPTIGACFTNNTGSTVTSLQISYTGEQWRLGNTAAARDDRLDLAFSLNATDLTTGTWTDVNALDFTNPIKTAVSAGALDGNSAANRTAISSTISSLSIANGATFWIRWTDLNASGADDGLAVDDFSLTPQGGPVIPTLNISDVAMAEGDPPGTTTFTFAVTLTAPAGPGGVTFDIATADGTAQDGNPGGEDNDYVAQSLTGQTIPIGSTGPYNFSVTVTRDTTTEPNETFFANVTNIVGANAGDVQGQGTINNDDVSLTPIHDIQGPGASSPIVGASVTTRGIVTGVKSNGFYIQEPDANVDADPATSEGIFVFTSSAPPAAAVVGALVQVTGTVAEFVPAQDPLQPPLTELTAPTVVQLSTGNPLPAAVPLSATFPDPAGVHDQLERLEGMRVSVASLTVVSPTAGNVNEANATSTSTGVFYGVVTGVPRPFREAGIRAPDPAPSGGTIPPIPRWDGNPELIRVDSDGLVGGALVDVSTGAVVTGLIGPLDYGFRAYTILPDPGVTLGTSGGLVATSVATPTNDEFTIASYNLERFFDTVNDPGIGEPVLTAAAFDRRLNKASLAIRNNLKMPDIVGVVEVENLTTLQALAARISADAIANSQPDPQYVAYLVEGNDVGGIDVGYLVKTAPVAGMTPRVAVVEVQQELDGTLFVNPDSSTETLNDRPPLRLNAIIHHGNGASFPVTVIVNHLRSLNGVNSETAGSNGWPTEGARVRAKRLKQAEDLANLVQTRQTADPTERIVLIGDFNAFEVNDGLVHSLAVLAGTPVPDNETAVPGDGVDLVNPDFDNLFDTPPLTERYSFVFDGSAQNLDHLLVNQPLIAGTLARRIEHARINADFAETARNDGTIPNRLSDHDPLVGYFKVQAFQTADLAITNTDSPDPVLAGNNLSYTIIVTNSGPNDAVNVSWSDTLPAGTIFVSLAQPGGWTCSTPLVGATGTVTCSLASLSVSNAVFMLVVNVDAGVTNGTVLSNTAIISSTTTDPNSDNNSDTAETTVNAVCPSTLTVNDLGDTPDNNPGNRVCDDGTGKCTLRAAIMEANALATGLCSPLTINFNVTGTLALAAALPKLLHPNLTINGPGANLLAVHGGLGYRVFDLGGGSNVTIAGLTLAQGNVTGLPTVGDENPRGGAVRVNNATLTLNQCAVLNSQAHQGGGLAVYNSHLTLNGCTVAGNVNTASLGGGLAHFGPGTLAITNSTFSGNSAPNAGGICLIEVSATLNHVTITGNTTTDGVGGLSAFSTSPLLSNSIIAGNQGRLGEVTGFTSQGFNLIGNGFLAIITNQQPSDQIGSHNAPLDPLLGPLGANGGPTPTHVPLPGSPALDKGGASSSLSADQRGLPRPYDIPTLPAASGGNHSDIGAVEIQCSTLTLAVLPKGTAGVAYAASQLVSGGAAPYALSLASGALPPGLAIEGSGLTGTPTQAGTFNFTLLAVDAYGCTGSQAYALTIGCPALTLSPVSLPNAELGAPYSQTLTAAPGGTAYNFAVTAGQLPPGLSLTSGGSLSGAPTTAGAFTFTVTAQGWGACTSARTYTLVVTATCPVITLNPASLAGGTVGSVYPATQLSATGGAGPYSFAVTAGALPAGLSLTNSGLLTGTPTASGVFNFSITVTGAGGCTGSRTYSLTILCPAISLSPATLPGAQAGMAYHQTLTASPTGTYSYSVLSGNLPPGLNLNAATGVMSGLATAPGTYQFTLKAQGAGGCSGTQAYSLVVSCPTVTVNPMTLPGGTAGTAYSQSLSASPAVNYSFARTSGTLPPGLNLSAAGVLSGTPTTAGTYTFTVTATGFGACTGSRSYTLTVTAACASITLPALPNGTVNVNYYGNLAGTTPSGSYTFSLDSGALPPGLVLDNLFAALVGKPTAAGTFNFTLKATRSNGCTGTRAYTVTSSNPVNALTRLSDFDGDGKSDLGVWRGAPGDWLVLRSSDDQLRTTVWGTAETPYRDVLAPGDYDGDGVTDWAIYRRADGQFYVRGSRTGQVQVQGLATGVNLPVVGDYDGDGRSDFAVWQPATGNWLIKRSSSGALQTINWGLGTAPYLDVPVPGDYDGDGKTDAAVFRPATGQWLILRSRDGGVTQRVWGVATDVPVAGDYDGDGKADLAVWRGVTGNWYVLRSSDGTYRVTGWGALAVGDVPAPADYDGDGKLDVAVWRASEGRWYVLHSSDGSVRTQQHGQPGDTPVMVRPKP
jgi:uncharacterized protein